MPLDLENPKSFIECAIAAQIHADDVTNPDRYLQGMTYIKVLYAPNGLGGMVELRDERAAVPSDTEKLRILREEAEARCKTADSADLLTSAKEVTSCESK